MTTELYDRAGDDAIVLRVHAQPGAGRSAIMGRYGDALKVKVAAPPKAGGRTRRCSPSSPTSSA